ncbi:MAG TPA: TIR domain-containing protein, partial [Alphaproteobacteria bacterium]|nr:TIR domain-containing protein [Alphaproteobacteria bacterium]
MIFISHSSKDHEIAMSICRDLESRGFHCWISSRDIQGGDGYQDSIDRAIRSAAAMILVFSARANLSPEIKKELALASTRNVTVVPVRAEDAMPTGALEYELITRQWIDLFGDRQEGLARLAQRLGEIAGQGQAADVPPAGPVMAKPPATRRRLIAGMAALGLLAIAVVAFLIFGGHGSAPALRGTATALSDGQVDAMLTRLNLYEADRNPSGAGISHRYQPQVIGDAVVVVDRATGLMWQKGQSDDAMGLQDADAYIAALNAQKYGGFTDWRLPTLEEAMSLVEPKATGELHISS